MTVRQVFYQATVKGLVEKSEAGYAKVQTDLTLMRRDGELPYDWLVDNTRMMRKPRSVSSIKQALDDTARLYRKNLWADADCYVEIWLEKDALSGVVYPVTSLYDAPLMVARGYASLSFLHEAADYIGSLEVPTYHLSPRRLRPVRRQRRSKDRSRPSARWRRTRKSISSGSRSPSSKSESGICRRARQKPAIAGRRALVTFRSNSTRYRRLISAIW